MVSFHLVLYAHCEVMSFTPQRVAMQPLSLVHSPCGPVRELSLCETSSCRMCFGANYTE